MAHPLLTSFDPPITLPPFPSRTSPTKTPTTMNAIFAPRPTVTASRTGASRITSRTPVTLDQVRAAAPSIFAEDRHSSRSERYSYIPTGQILEGLMREGFQIFAATQGGSRVEGKREFTKHTVRLRHVDAKSLAVGDSFPEIILGNSHDGTSSYTLRSGVFRLACLNGMVVCEQSISDIKVPHKGDVMGQVIDGCIEVLGQLPRVSESIREWSALTLDPGETLALARAAHAMRYDDPAQAPIRPEQLLTSRRYADTGADLWKTFNRIQETVIKGGTGYTRFDDRGRAQFRRTREVAGIDQNTSLNRGLWTLAAEMAKLKA